MIGLEAKLGLGCTNDTQQLSQHCSQLKVGPICGLYRSSCTVLSPSKRIMMSLSDLTLHLATFLYPLPDLPNKPGKELKVICVGLPRSGTESLHYALQTLGYDGVAHG